MIEATRALLAQTDARIDEVADEFARLQELRDALETSKLALERFIEQSTTAPGAAPAADVEDPAAPPSAASSDTPEPAAPPPGGAAPVIDAPSREAGDRARTRRTRGRSAAGGLAHEPASPAAASSRAAVFECPECGRLTPTETGLAIHRARMHGIASARRSNGAEKFLCSHCSFSFLSRAGRDEHEATHVIADPPPPSGGERIRRSPPRLPS